MKLTTAAGLCAWCVFARGAAAGPSVPFGHEAEDDPDPYAVISERNIFHLNPVPAYVAPPAPKPDVPIVKFSGWFKVGKVTKALFVSEPKDKAESPKYYDLTEGERDGELELLKIHFNEDKVDVINSGVAMTLSLKDDNPSAKPEKAPDRRGFNHHGMPPQFANHSLGDTHGIYRKTGDGSPAFPTRPRRAN